MKYLVLLCLPFFLFGSKILSYNVYERSNRVDLMITFDTPFDGKLSQIKKNNKIILKLDNASIEAPKIKNLNTSFLHKMTITPIGSHTEVILQTAANIKMTASKTSDAYGLRLRFQKNVPVLQSSTAHVPALSSTSNLETKQDAEFNNSYYIVIAILLLGIFIMLWLKKKMGPSHDQGKQPWLFKTTKKKEGISVRFQKPLDPKNRVAMLDFEGQSYLVLLGNTNVLLDKYAQGKPIRTQNEFDKVLDDNKAELDSYLKLDNIDTEPLQSYKEKASAQNYELR
ncbi:hypothetical protein JHD50_01630 [Sulfurimonas sp. MAG313]|nr:hypothetical protein [Sulfurimonas sp. MAG313]MDF1880010.1 hypothetical protein [Sulfurimonas sp. MAG313]